MNPRRSAGRSPTPAPPRERGDEASSAGSASSPIVRADSADASAPSNRRPCRRSSSNVAYVNRWSVVLPTVRVTRRPASGTGRLRRSRLFTSEKIAVFAPILSARDRMTTVVTMGASSEGAKREEDVAPQTVNPPDASGVAAHFLDLVETAELEAGADRSGTRARRSGARAPAPEAAGVAHRRRGLGDGRSTGGAHCVAVTGSS